MSDKEILIESQHAIPDSKGHLPALSYKIHSATLVCFLSRQLHVSNQYMQMLAGLSKPQSGTIDYFNCECETPTRRYFPAIAYLSHNSSLLSILNGIENVKLPALYHQLGTKKQIDAKVNALLGELDYDANHKVLPAFMTAFQKQHLLIARAIMLQPKLLFIEDPFTGLGFNETRMLEDYLFSLVSQKNISVIIGNPSLEFIENYADQIIVQLGSCFHFFENWDSFYFYKQRHKLRF